GAVALQQGGPARHGTSPGREPIGHRGARPGPATGVRINQQKTSAASRRPNFFTSPNKSCATKRQQLHSSCAGSTSMSSNNKKREKYALGVTQREGPLLRHEDRGRRPLRLPLPRLRRRGPPPGRPG